MPTGRVFRARASADSRLRGRARRGTESRTARNCRSHARRTALLTERRNADDRLRDREPEEIENSAGARAGSTASCCSPHRDWIALGVSAGCTTRKLQITPLLQARWPRPDEMRSGPRSGFRWTKENIVYAIDLWHRRHLRPPTAREWKSAGDDHPSAPTVRRVFGTWNRAIRASGFRSVGPGRRRVKNARELDGSRRWSESRIITSIRLWTLSYGRPPLLDEWRQAAPGRPCVSTVARRFGSWNRAIEAAGFVPRDRRETLRNGPRQDRDIGSILEQVTDQSGSVDLVHRRISSIRQPLDSELALGVTLGDERLARPIAKRVSRTSAIRSRLL